jgi:GNAT superfamily N-acetyltransferase
MDLTLGRGRAITRSAAVARFGERQVRTALALNIWVSPWTGIYVDQATSGEFRTLAAAAVALGGPRTVLSGPTAAHLHGLDAMPATPIHLMTPYGRKLRSRPGLVVHNGPLPATDLTEIDGLPVLGFERVVSDLACTAGPADGLAVLDQALASVPPAGRERLRATLAGRLRIRPDPRGTRLAAALLAVATGRAESPAESWMLWQVVDDGFPVPEVNWSLLAIDGRELYRLDLSWPELRIAAEFHGYAAHAGREAGDAARGEDLRRRSWIVIDVWGDDLGASGRYLGELERAFLRRGIDVRGRAGRQLRGRRHRERS